MSRGQGEPSHDSRSDIFKAMGKSHGFFIGFCDEQFFRTLKLGLAKKLRKGR
jgi:hypothetical protein